MTILSTVLPLLGFVVVAIGGRAVALLLRRRGHGVALDAIELRGRTAQLKLMRGKAAMLRSVKLPARRVRRDAADID